MKKFSDLPVYFLVFGLIINILIYFYHPVPFVQLMLRSILVIIVFSVTGYLLASVLNSAAEEISKTKRRAEEAALIARELEKNKPVIDIKVDSQDEDELLRDLATPEKDEFEEIDISSFKRFLDQD